MPGARSIVVMMMVVVLIVLTTGAAPARADELPDYQPDEFDLLFRTAPLAGLAHIGRAPAITGNTGVDRRIRQIAEQRGYLRRPLADGALVWNDGMPMQASMVEGWDRLQAAASAAGRPIGVASAYRSHAEQVQIFVSKLTGTSDSAIDTRLRTAAAPGYSKHHTGYALDLYAAGRRFTSFGSTSAYAWLSADNAEAAKRAGFIPSYPPGAGAQGPIPEPWEWIYVGVDVIECGRPTIGMPAGSFDPGVSCPDYPISRGVAANLTRRALDVEPGDGDLFDDDDGFSFEPDVDALSARGLAEGCGERRFCPFEYLSRGELASWMVTAFGLEDLPTGGAGFEDTSGSPHETDIARVVGVNLMTACSDSRFCPDDRARRTDLVSGIVAARETGVLAPVRRFADAEDSVFDGDTRWLVDRGITRGCNPPLGDLFCPEDPVTRAQMAAFLRRALDLDPGSVSFVDTEGSVFAADIAALASAGITLGCNPPVNDRFCPGDEVTRGQMAAFLRRALDLDPGSVSFVDTEGSVFAADIAALASAGITLGCNPPVNDRFCPGDEVTRGQMAAFLHRAIG